MRIIASPHHSRQWSSSLSHAHQVVLAYQHRRDGRFEKGEYYTAANGGKIFSKGDRVVTMMSQEGHLCNMRFTSCDVERALGSVSSICKQGHTVVFNAPDHPDGSYIYNINPGERMDLKHNDGVFVLDTRVAPSTKQASPFAGQGLDPWEQGY